jgi:hypothetical protein
LGRKKRTKGGPAPAFTGMRSVGSISRKLERGR